MNKKYCLRLLVATLSFTVCTNANAQFFKKLGKTIESAAKAIDSVTGTTDSKSSANSTSTSGVSLKCGVPNFEVKFKDVTIVDGQQHINFIMTNKASKTQRVYSFERMKVFDDQGNQYESRSVVGNRMTSLGNGDVDFEPGVPVKGKIILIDCPLATKKLSLAQIRCTSWNNGYNDAFIEFRNVDLTVNVATTATIFTATKTCAKPTDTTYKSATLAIKQMSDGYVVLTLTYNYAKKTGQVKKTYIGKFTNDLTRTSVYETTGLNLNQSNEKLLDEATDGPDIEEWYLYYDKTTKEFTFLKDTFK